MAQHDFMQMLITFDKVIKLFFCNFLLLACFE